MSKFNNKFSSLSRDISSSNDLIQEYNKTVDKIKEDNRRIEEKAHKEVNDIMFSEKRGSVPLLPNTYVIRGSFPKQRQKVKRALDLIGDEAPMKSINTVLINPDQDIPLVFMGENTVGLSERFLTGSDGEIAKLILSSVYRKVHPESSDGAEYAYATDVVEPKVREKIRRESEEKNLDNLEIHQVGTEEQPRYDIEKPESVSEEYKINLVVPEEKEEKTDVQMLGVGSEPEKYMKSLEEKALAPSIYYGGEQQNG